MKKVSRILPALLAFTLLASACGSADPAKNNSENASGKENELSMLTWYIEANSGKYAEDTAFYTSLDEYKKSHPDITLSMESIGGADYNQKLKTLAAATSLPDVFITSANNMANFLENDLLYDFTDHLNENQDIFTAYREGTFDRATREERIYGYPVACGPLHLFVYNSKILSEAGYDEFPKTWDDMLDMCEKIKANGVTPFGIGNKTNLFMEEWISTLTDRIVGSDWVESIIANDGASYTDEPFVQALSMVDDMREKGYFNKDMNSVDNQTIRTYFYDEQIAVYNEPIFNLLDVINNAPADVLEVTEIDLMPAVSGGVGNPRNTNAGAGVYWCASSSIEGQGDRETNAIELIEAISGKTTAEVMASYGGFPAYKPTDFDRTKLHRLQQRAYDLAEEAPASKIFSMWFEAPVVDVLNTNIQNMLVGTATPEEVAEATQAEYERIKK